MLRINTLTGFGVVPVVAGGSSTNFALAANGSSASATGSAGWASPSALIDGLRHTNNAWGSTGGWEFAGAATVEVDFGTSRTIDEVDVFTLADAVQYNTNPTLADTFSSFGVQSYTVDYWNGSTWVNLATVTGNNKVWRQHTFGAVATTKIRVDMTVSPDSVMRLVEVEAWG